MFSKAILYVLSPCKPTKNLIFALLSKVWFTLQSKFLSLQYMNFACIQVSSVSFEGFVRNV
jgi:hypothetical protein